MSLKNWIILKTSRKVRIQLEETETQVKREVRQEEVRDQLGISRPQKIRHMSARLQDYVITSDDVVDNEGELVHYAFYAYVKPVSATEALKDTKWVKEMNEEVKSIEDNNTWSKCPVWIETSSKSFE